MAAWTVGLEHWAVTRSKVVRVGDQELDYFLGVILAASVAQHHLTSLTDAEQKRLSMESLSGYLAAGALIKRVERFGDAPHGDYRTLLDAPDSSFLA